MVFEWQQCIWMGEVNCSLAVVLFFKLESSIPQVQVPHSVYECYFNFLNPLRRCTTVAHVCNHLRTSITSTLIPLARVSSNPKCRANFSWISIRPVNQGCWKKCIVWIDGSMRRRLWVIESLFTISCTSTSTCPIWIYIQSTLSNMDGKPDWSQHHRNNLCLPGEYSE